MKNRTPQLEGYEKILMFLCFVCMAANLVLIFLLAFEVVTFPLYVFFIPMIIMNILGTIAMWKRVTKPMRIALIMSVPLLLVCAVVLQFII